MTTEHEETETSILQAVRLALGSHPSVVLWRNNVGLARFTKNGRPASVRYGLCPGSADLVGIISPSGRMFALEVKTPTGKLSAEQQKWIALVRSMGGFATTVQSPDEAIAALARALDGATQ